MTKIYAGNIKKAAKDNEFFRKVLFTGAKSQLVLMSLEPGQAIGEEIHEVDQVIYAVAGDGKAELDGVPTEFEKGFIVFVPAGMRHNVINTDKKPMKLFTVYAPPQHPDGTIHRTKSDADLTEKMLEPARA